MSKVQKLVLTMVLVVTGLLAGLQMLMLMGVLPAMMRMPLATYAGMWQALDHFMAARMGIFANGTLLLYLAAIGCFARSPGRASSGAYWAALSCWRQTHSLLLPSSFQSIAPYRHSIWLI